MLNQRPDHRHGEAVPDLSAWVNHGATWLYWQENMCALGGHPMHPSDLPELLTHAWYNLPRDKWASFLGTALLGAVYVGHLEGVQQLLSAGATLRARDRHGLTPLHLASSGGHVDIVGRLLADRTDSLPALPLTQSSQLRWQSSKNGICLVTSVSRLKKSTVDARDSLGSSPLHLAAACGNVTIARLLLHNGADPCMPNTGQQTPLHSAALGSRGDMVELLEDAGGDVMARDNAGRTPLHAAACEGTPATISVLTTLGADIEAKGSIAQFTPLHEACAWLRPENARELLNLGADETATDILDQIPCDVVGKSVTSEVLDVTVTELIRGMLRSAPKNRTWRRRRLLLLVRWRQPPFIHHHEGSNHMAREEELFGATVIGLEEGVFRNVVSYL